MKTPPGAPNLRASERPPIPQSHRLSGGPLEQYQGTTILSVRRDKSVVIGGDGQITMGNTVMKGNARKVRRLYKDLSLIHI